MSNEEKKRRSNYRKRRQTIIIILLAVIGCFSILSIFFGIRFIHYGKEEYIDYNEKSDIDYKVYLKPNNFYEEEYLEKGHSYIASLIDHIEIDFSYLINMEVEDINYECVYWIDTELEIIDVRSNKSLYNPTDTLIMKTKIEQNSNEQLSLKKNIKINYDEYNLIANEFNDVYNLSETSNNLIVTMHVNIISQSKEFKEDTNKAYDIRLIIPLTQKTVDISISSSVPANQSKVLVCKNIKAERNSRNLLISCLVLDLIAVVGLIVFSYMTRNTDINYTIKVKRILNAYKSYIQKIKNEFDDTGYRKLFVSSFNEMLDIRDTIKLPILMFENDDHTMSTFLIPTDNDLLYIFEIKVDDYDNLYNDDYQSDITIKDENIEKKNLSIKKRYKNLQAVVKSSKEFTNLDSKIILKRRSSKRKLK